MTLGPLIIALGDARYRVERPWGDLTGAAGFVSDVAVDPRGHVHVLMRRDAQVEPGGQVVIELDGDGRQLAAWGGDLIADGHMLAAGPDGRLLIVDRDAHEIVITEAGGRRLGSLGTRHRPLEPFNHPTDVAVAPSGEVFVSDGYGASLVHRFSATGEHVQSWGEIGRAPGQLLDPHAVWITPDGHILIADRGNDRVQVFGAEGWLLAVWEGFSRPMDIWGDAAGNAFVTDQVPSLHRFDASGRRTGRCRPVLNGAHGVSGDAEGRLYLAEMNPSRITRLVPV